jgi:tRNA-Thr(GGU) m(6)t(6)A37 methyltransferase TsaA
MPFSQRAGIEKVATPWRASQNAISVGTSGANGVPLALAEASSGRTEATRSSVQRTTDSTPPSPQSQSGAHVSAVSLPLRFDVTGPSTRRMTYLLKPIGVVRSSLEDRESAPRQGREGAPDARIELAPSVLEGLQGIGVGDEIVVVTWLHEARRDVLKVHPRCDRTRPLAGVFATRSPDRPNPLGLHRVTVLEIAGRELKVGPLEAIDGTPVIDLKPVLEVESE